MSASTYLDTSFLEKFCRLRETVQRKKIVGVSKLKEASNLFVEFENESRVRGRQNNSSDLVEESYCWSLYNSLSQFEMTYKNLSQENLQKKRDYISTLSPADPDSLPTSQLDLIDDIITTSEELVALHFLINWLNTTKADVDYTYVVPLNFSKTLQGQHDYNNGKQTLEPDFLFNNTKGVDLLKENFKGQHSTFHLDQVTVNDHMKLLKKCFELLRSGDYIEAYKTLSNNNMGWRAVTLSGGLPFHDFKIYDQRDQVSCRREAELEKKRRFLLDFMQTKEWSDTLEARDNFYPINHNDFDNANYFNETIGNINWLVWLSNVYKMSKDKSCEGYEKGIYALIAGQIEFLEQNIFIEERPNAWYDKVWANIRAFTYNEIYRRYLRVYSALKNEIPMFDPNEDESNNFLENIEKSEFGQHLYKSRDYYRDILMYLDEMDLTADSIYKKVQAKTMKAKLNAIIDKENAQDNWSELINHLYDYSKSLTKRSRENLEKLRFCAYYAISLNFFEIKSSDLQFLDNIMANYLNALSEYGFRGEELITLYSTIEQEEKRIKCLANYLISIENNEERMKYKSKIEAMYKTGKDFQKKLVQEIIDANETAIRTRHLEKEKARLNSVNWMLQWKDPTIDETQIIDNLNHALILLRKTIRDENYNLTAAYNLMKDDIEKMFKQAEPLIRDNKRVQRYFKEKESHNIMFEAFNAMKTYKNLSATDKLNEKNVKDILNNYKISEKINFCLFGKDWKNKKVEKAVIFDTAALDAIFKDDLSTKELKEIKVKVTPMFLYCLIEVYDKYNFFDDSYTLLKNISSSDDCSEVLGNSNVEEFVKKIVELIMKNPRIISSLLQSKKIIYE